MDLSYLKNLSRDQITDLAEKGDVYAQLELVDKFRAEVLMMQALSGKFNFDPDTLAGKMVSDYLYWLHRACEHDISETREAQFELGEIYYFGRHMQKQDRYIAACLFDQSARQGYAPAQVQYARCVLDGDAERNNDIDLQGSGWRQALRESVAFRLFQLAAEQNDTMGLIYMGACYADGIGVNADMEKAKEWFIKAARNGSKEAKLILKKDFGIYL